MSCTLPPPDVRYVSTPNIRGTMDIITTSLSVIVLSTWSVLHLGVPVQTRPRTWRQKLTRSAIRASAKFTWMLVTIAGPELLVGRGMMQLARARRSKKELQRYVSKDQVEWSLAHSFFADMRGFEIVFSEGRTEPGYDLGSDSEIWQRTAACTPQAASIVGAALAKFTLELQLPETAHRKCCRNSVEKIQRSDVGPIAERLPSYHKIQAPETGITCVSFLEDRQDFKEEPASYDVGSGAVEEGSCDCQADVLLNPALRSRYYALTNLYVSRLAAINARQQIDGKALGPILWRPDAVNFDIVVRADQLACTMQLSDKARTALGANLYAFQGTSWRLNAAQLAEARSLGIIEKLPSLSHDDLEDKGSSDGFLNALTLFQIIWQLVEVVTREVQGLPIAPLEVLALALAMCAVITWICLWCKPQEICTTTKFKASRSPRPEEVIAIAIKGDVPGDSPLKRGPVQLQFYDTGFRAGPQDNWYLVFGLLIGSAVFGSLHFLSWNHTFPTKVEQMLWHVSAIASLVVPWLAALTYILTHAYLLPFIQKMTPGTIKHIVLVHVSITLGVTLQAFYVLVRLYVAVECVRSVFFLEPEAFRSTWTIDIPHFR